MPDKINVEKIKELALTEDIDFLSDSSDKEKVFAACYKACQKHLGITPYNEQLSAAYELSEGKIAEMKTGEGKTLSAVFAACHHVKTGGKVHILTFNDYLAKRDYNWMKPIYDELSVSVGFITQDTSKEEKQKAYGCDVLYITARECGFDFLRDFVAERIEDTVQQGFDFAIVDEADSIMIDEGRVPLVIAGETAVTPDEDVPAIYSEISSFPDDHYELDEENGTIFLTPAGEDKCEELFIEDGSGLYELQNNELLTKITDCLKAAYTLKKDVHYIVKDESIRIIDEFTGRAAENRRYPGTLQAAVEAKEGITATSRGVIMGVVPIQFFLRQYEKVSGMTGTAKSSEEEFLKMYDLLVTEIPTHSPCRRTDHPNDIFLTKEEKWNAVADCVEKAHAKNQPVLIGTANIEDSEYLNEKLSEKGIEAAILSAKNDELEADIIKDAGKPGAVTISANMSGRGVDIKLGGADESEKQMVEEAGGLLVIGTYLTESERGNMQLRGRSGRQGDVGESKFFISLEDDIMIKYEAEKLIPSRHYPKSATGMPVTDKVVIRECARVQRIAHGDTYELRKRLLNFTLIGEKHRDAVFGRRKAFLSGEAKVSIWQDNFPDAYDDAVSKFGTDAVNELQLKVILQTINDYWCDYLDYTSYLRDGIHLMRVAGKNPADEYNIACEDFFSGMEEQVIACMGEELEKLCAMEDISEFTINTPSALWTYILNESGEELLVKGFVQIMLEDAPLEDESNAEYCDDDYYDDKPPRKKEEEPKSEKKGFFARLFGK